MAYLTQSLGSYSTHGGTITATLYYSDSVLVTFPASWKPITSFGEIAERCEEKTGIIEIPSMTVSLLDHENASYPHGVLYSVISQTIDGDVELPEIRFELDRNGTYSVLFWGVFDLRATTFEEHYASDINVYIRTVEARLVSALYRMADTDFDTFLTNLTANRGVEENPYQKASPSSSYSGVAGALTFGYRVAVRDANGEYAWSNETTVSSCSDLGGGNEVTITWGAVTGATAYAVYRTTVSGGPLLKGYLGVVTSGVSFVDDGDPDGTGTTTQTKLSARKFVKYTDFFRQSLVEAFGVSYSSSLVPNMVDDVRPKYGSTSIGTESIWFQYWRNTGSVDIPTMGYTPYFDSTNADGEYFGARYNSPLELLGTLARQFAHFPKFYDIESSSGAGIAPRIDLLSRRQPLITPTLDGNLIASTFSMGSEFNYRSIEAHRGRHKLTRYSTNDALKNWELEIPCEFAFTVNVSGTTADGAAFSEAAYERVFYVVQSTTTTAYVCNGAEYYNGSWQAAGTDTHVVNLDDGTTAGLKVPLQAALVEYYKALTNRKTRSYERQYKGITATSGGVSSEEYATVLARVAVSDGNGSRNYYINEARKDVENDLLWVRLVEQV